jgi:hypothetical protein
VPHETVNWLSARLTFLAANKRSVILPSQKTEEVSGPEVIDSTAADCKSIAVGFDKLRDARLNAGLCCAIGFPWQE